MKYWLYCSHGNVLGLDEVLQYSEIGESGHWTRDLQINASGQATRYSSAHAADGFGQLPEGVFELPEGSMGDYGSLVPISRDLFEAVWSVTACINDLSTA
jgi:hypothetical protein